MRRLLRSDRAQNTFEFMLILGIVVVAMVIGLLLFDSVIVTAVGHVCPSVDTANTAVAVGSCLGIT